MHNKKLDPLIQQMENYLECWKQFNHFVNLARAKKFSPEDENLLRMVADQVQSAAYRDRLHDRTRVDSLTDSLTGLHNRRFLEQFVS